MRTIDEKNVKTNVDWEEKEKGLTHVDILKTDETEARTLSGENNIERVAEKLSTYGIDEVIITRGTHGSLIYSKGEFYDIPAFPARKILDATGCGDTYIAAYIYKRLQSSDINEKRVIRSIFTTFVFSREQTFALNRIFALATLFLGLFNMLVGISYIPLILTEIHVEYAVQVAYSFLVLSLGIFLLSSLILQYSSDFRFRNLNLGLLGVITLVAVFFLWFTETILPTITEHTRDIYQEISILGSLSIFFLVILFLFFRTYQETTWDTRKKGRCFCAGWLVGGIVLIFSALSTFIH